MSELATKIAAILPAVGAILLLALSPLLSRKVSGVLRGQINADLQRSGFPANTPIPPPVETEVIIKVYIDYAADAVQIVPATVLPVLGAVFSVAANLDEVAALTTLTLTLITAIALDSWLLSSSASDYTSRKRYGYSVITLAAACSNLASIVLIAVFG